MKTSVNTISDDLIDLGNSKIDASEDDLHDNDEDDNIAQMIWNCHDNNISCSEESIGSGHTLHGRTSYTATTWSFV